MTEYPRLVPVVRAAGVVGFAGVVLRYTGLGQANSVEVSRCRHEHPTTAAARECAADAVGTIRRLDGAAGLGGRPAPSGG